MAAAVRQPAPRHSIRTIWGLAKSPGLALSEDDLYALVWRETGKEHMRELSQGEIDKVCRALAALKASSGAPPAPAKRWPGNMGADRLRGKVYAMSYQLGWNGDKARINGLVRKMFEVSALEWLNARQCSQLIEAMKAMAEREKQG